MEYLTTKQLEEYIMTELARGNCVIPDTFYFVKNKIEGEDCTYIFSDKQGYHIVQSERGSEITHKLTDDIFEITFWTISMIFRTMAIKYMAKVVKPGDNQRKIIFEKELDLYKQIGDSYLKAGEIRIGEIIKNNPL
jgi:hypothetical protein